MMNIDRMTQKAQEALKDWQAVAVRYGHQEIDGEHMLKALLEQEGGLGSSLLGRLALVVS
jgi:ATP-dependent Clp protease ATP-binding subunit ClpB